MPWLLSEMSPNDALEWFQFALPVEPGEAMPFDAADLGSSAGHGRSGPDARVTLSRLT